MCSIRKASFNLILVFLTRILSIFSFYNKSFKSITNDEADRLYNL